jgi:hypothetical protein
MFIFQFLFVALGVRYILHNNVKQINIDGTRMSKIFHTYDKIFTRTLPTHMVSCIDFSKNGMNPEEDPNADVRRKVALGASDNACNEVEASNDNIPLEILDEIFIKKPTEDVFLGNDMRPNKFPEIPIEKIIELNTKRQLLTTLENNHVSLVTKISLCDKFNREKQSYSANLLSGGLAREFDLFT